MAFPSAFDLPEVPADTIAVMMSNMRLDQRATCARVCADWAKAAAGTTHTIIKHGSRDLTGLQQWLEKNGSQIDTMQLHGKTGMTRQGPCTQLQDLLLHGMDDWDDRLTVGSRVWSDIAAATKLTSLSLQWVYTASQQAVVVSALTALPDLQQLTWRAVQCGRKETLSDSRLLQHLTKLTGLELDDVSAKALQHLGSVSKLQHLRLGEADVLVAADMPGLQQLTALTSLQLDPPLQGFVVIVSHLTALQQLEVSAAAATPTELNGLEALTALTKLHVGTLQGDATPLLLPALQQLDLQGALHELHMSQLSSCTQLRRLTLRRLRLVGPDSLVASSMLQELHLRDCKLSNPGVEPWQLVFPGPGRPPGLTSLELHSVPPAPTQADLQRLVACCSGLRVLKAYSGSTSLPINVGVFPNTPAFACLSRLTSLKTLHLSKVNNKQCSSLAQLTGLQELEVTYPGQLARVGLQQLARLQQLTSLSFVHEFDPLKVSAELQAELFPEGSSRALVNKAPPGSPPDVSARLLSACAMAAGDQQQ